MKKLILILATTVTINAQFSTALINPNGTLVPGNPITVANLPAVSVAGTRGWCSDILTPRGPGGWVTYNGSYWMSDLNIRAASDPIQFFRNCSEAGVNFQGSYGVFRSSVLNFIGFSAGDTIGQRMGTSSGAGSGWTDTGFPAPYGSGAIAQTGSTAAGACAYFGQDQQGVYATTGYLTHGGVYSIPTLCTSTEGFWLIVGLQDTSAYPSTSWPTSGAFFLYDNLSTKTALSGAQTNNWYCVTKNGATVEYKDSGLVVGSSVKNKLQVIVTPTATIFYTNSIACYTNSTVANQYSGGITYTAKIVKTAGTTSRTFYEWQPFSGLYNTAGLVTMSQ